MSSTDHIEQCKHDEYMESIIEEKGEGCRMWGRLEVCSSYICWRTRAVTGTQWETRESWL